MAAAAIGLPSAIGLKMAKAAEKAATGAAKKPSVVWLHFQECTGCTETLLRTTHPELAHLILDVISLDYHETLSAAAGDQAHQNLEDAVERGGYVCVVEGAIPTKDNGVYCKIHGETAIDMLNRVAAKAAAVIALGSCASFGGLPAADPNPTGAQGAPQILAGKTVVTIPGCPPNPYNFLGTVLHFLTFGKLPTLDEKGRPKFAYGRTIHEHCPRRPHFDAGRFAQVFGDDGHRDGYCLYALGCKGPQTHANCSTQHFGEVDGAWPIGVGHPCVGCTEEHLLWRTAIHDTIDIERPTPPTTYAPVTPDKTGVDPVATGVGGLVGGLLLGAGLVAAKKLGDDPGPPEPPDAEDEQA